MTRWIYAVMTSVVMAGASATAQWPVIPDPTVPRTADGKINYDAPTPRTPDGHPDLSASDGPKAAPLVRAAAGAEVSRAACSPTCRLSVFRPESQRPSGRDVQQRRRQHGRRSAVHAVGEGHQESADGGQQQGQSRRELPADGLHAVPHAPQPRKIVQTSTLIVIHYEANYGCGTSTSTAAGCRRRASRSPGGRLLGRPLGGRHAGRGNEQPAWRRGQPLRRLARRARQPVQRAGKVRRTVPPSHFRESRNRRDVDDPKAYTKPFTVRVNQRLMADQELMDFICNENKQFE